VKSASNEQEFHVKRMEDLLPQVKGLKDTIKQQEVIILNLQNVIKENIKNADVMHHKEVSVYLQKLRHDHEILQEKNKQVHLNDILGFIAQITVKHKRWSDPYGDI
jgi:S-adenosylmethionine:tRNA-ribosyltransferase-isomerase (queuine synthetase)